LAFDYSGDAAVLFGNTKITSDSNSGSSTASNGTLTTGLGTGTASTASSQAGLLSNSHWSSQIVVWNLDVQGGFSYWFNPNLKLGLSYRLDAFLDALRTAPDDTGAFSPGRSIDRFYHGPKITLTGRIN